MLPRYDAKEPKQNDTITLKVEKPLACLVYDQHIFNWTENTLNKKETIPGTRTLTNFNACKVMDIGEEPTPTNLLNQNSH